MVYVNDTITEKIYYSDIWEVKSFILWLTTLCHLFDMNLVLYVPIFSTASAKTTIKH